MLAPMGSYPQQPHFGGQPSFGGIPVLPPIGGQQGPPQIGFNISGRPSHTTVSYSPQRPPQPHDSELPPSYDLVMHSAEYEIHQPNSQGRGPPLQKY
jgi:hypothetical protein